MKFKVVSGDYLTDDDYDKFKDLYLNRLDLNMKEIGSIVGISRTMVLKWSKKVREETGLVRRGNHQGTGKNLKLRKYNQKEKKSPKFYYFNKIRNKYEVYKVIKGKRYSIGMYDTEDEAKETVEFMKSHNWDMSYIGVLRGY